MKPLKDKIKDLNYYNEKEKLKEILFELEEKQLEGDIEISIDEIAGVEIDAPIEGQSLQYDSTKEKWVNKQNSQLSFTDGTTTVQADVNGLVPLSDLSLGGSSTAAEVNPLTMLVGGDNEFTVIATAIARPTGTGTNNDPITWELIEDDSHVYSLTTDLTTGIGGGLGVNYPNMKKVITFLANPDETMAANGVFLGSSVTTTTGSIAGYRSASHGFRMVGNGSGWTISGDLKGSFSASHSTSNGKTIVTTSSSVPYDGQAAQAQYVGANNYRLERQLTGNSVVFYLRDIATNTVVTTAPTSDDGVQISNTGSYPEDVSFYDYENGSVLGNLFLDDTQINIWILGVFEAWMKVWIVSDTSLRAKWQEHTTATSYKLYRDTNEDFSTATLLYSGTNLQYLDTGLTANTTYYYRLDDELDAEITRFTQKTRRAEH